MAYVYEQNEYTGGSYNLLDFYTNYDAAQTFTIGAVGPNQTHQIYSVKIWLRRVGSPGTITIGIRNTDVNGIPTGANLTSATMNGNTLPTTGLQEKNIIFSSQITLSAGTKYALVLSAQGDFDNYALIAYSTNIYAGGVAFSCDAGSWYGYSNRDLYFIEFSPNPPQAEICTWVIDHGGPTGIEVTEVFEIIDSYLYSIPPIGYSFIPTITQAMGIIDYYLGFVASGNTETGCSF